jgi:hypothetical protein
LYDPSTGTFTATGDMTEARWWHTATLLTNGKVFIAGGIRNDGYTTELYDPENGTFSRSARSANSGLSPASASLLMNGKVLAARV